jgi:hypothetical protein
MFSHPLRALFAKLSRPARPARRRPPARHQLIIELLEDRTVPSSITWIGGAHNSYNTTSGDPAAWSNPYNWLGWKVPGAGDTAAFSGQVTESFTSPGGATFTFGPSSPSTDDYSVALTSLQFDGSWGGVGSNGGILNVNAALSVSGTSEWDSGKIGVNVSSGSLANSGTLTINNGSGNVVLDGGGTFTNSGTIVQKGAGNLAIDGPSNTDPTNLVITATGSYDFQADSNLTSIFGAAGGGAIQNAGLIEKTLPPGQTVDNGTSALNGNLTLTNNGGTLDAATGMLQVAISTADTNGTYQTAAGAFLDLTGGQIPAVFAENGTAFTGAGAGTVLFDAGTLSIGAGGATFSISGESFDWGGGTINVPVASTLTYDGSLTADNSGVAAFGGGGTVVLNGSLTQNGNHDIGLAGTSGGQSTTLTIPAGSHYYLATDYGIENAGYSGGILSNAGTIEKISGLNTSTIATVFDNTGGTLNVQTGTLQLAPTGGTNTGGTFIVASNAVLDLTGGKTVNYAGTYTGSGSGQIWLNSGTLMAASPSGPMFNFAKGLFRWNGGTIDTNNETVTLLTGALITSSGSGTNPTEQVAGGGTLSLGSATASAVLTDSGSDNNLYIASGTILSIAAKGTFDLTNDANLRDSYGSVVNAGTFEKTGGSSTSFVEPSFDDSNGKVSGKVSVSRATLDFTGAVNQVSNGHLTAGSWSVTGTTLLSALMLPGSFTTIDPGVSVTLSGPLASFSNLSGLTTNNGSLSLLGTVLTVNGGFTNSGTLTFQVTYSGKGSQVGEIVTGSSGSVKLGGTLVVTVKGTPPSGTNLTLLDDGNSNDTWHGSFSTEKLPSGYQLLTTGGDGNDLVLHKN